MLSHAGVFVVLILIRNVPEIKCAGWSYVLENHSGPQSWHKSFRHCGGARQSPIDLDESRAVYQTFPEWDLEGYRRTDSVNMTLKNSGHTVKVAFSGYPISISGGGLPAQYTLLQLHFHLGNDSQIGSEHHLNGKQFPMEVHLVHRITDLTTVDAFGDPNGFAVLGFFFELSQEDNEKLDVLLKHLERVVLPGTDIEIETFPLSDLLPVSGADGYHFFRYDGSLTTPPCYEAVIWSVFTGRINISEKQIQMFRSLRDDSGQPMANNFRPPIEMTSDRTVYVNKQSDKKVTNEDINLGSGGVSCTGPQVAFLFFTISSFYTYTYTYTYT